MDNLSVPLQFKFSVDVGKGLGLERKQRAFQDGNDMRDVAWWSRG